jgi:hypothetical protein
MDAREGGGLMGSLALLPTTGKFVAGRCTTGPCMIHILTCMLVSGATRTRACICTGNPMHDTYLQKSVTLTV